MQRIVRACAREHEGRRVPVILFTKGGGAWLDAHVASGCDALGVDWTTDLADARAPCRIASRCRAIWTRTCFMRRRRRSATEVAHVLASYGAGTVTCSISVTGSIRASIRSMPAR